MFTRRLACAALVVGAACSDAAVKMTEAGPVAGELELVLDSPFENDGAVWLRIRGPDVSGHLTASEGLAAVTDASDGALELVVAGAALGGPLARLTVPDVDAASLYSVDVVQVADDSNALRSDVDGYTVEVRVR